MTFPIYESPEAKQLPEGMYLGMFHGRESPESDMDYWGFDGPVIGPISAYHTTYMDTLRIKFVNEADAIEAFGANADEWNELTTEQDLLKFQDSYYGDWTVFYHRGGSTELTKGPLTIRGL